MMHYYKRNIGDYHKKAGRLSILQHGIYMLLLDACYDREKFPTKEEAIEWVWACSDEEIKAVDFVLSKFFVLDGDLYIQNRVKEDVEAYKNKCVANKKIADDRETKRKNKPTKRVDNARNVDETPPNHKPLTNNHKPITINQEPNDDDFSIKALKVMKLHGKYMNLRMNNQYVTYGQWDSYLKDWEKITNILSLLADIARRVEKPTSINYFVTALAGVQAQESDDWMNEPDSTEEQPWMKGTGQ